MSFAYLKTDGAPISVAEGELPNYATLLAPATKFDIWNEELGAWEFNRDAWLNEDIRPTRNRLLDAADQRVRRYDYQLRANVETADTYFVIEAVLAYMQVLRDLPGTTEYVGFEWPAVP